jgi:hypothetical protein
VEIAFVTAPRQNTFFSELVEAMRDELGRAGVASSVSTDGFPPPRRGLVYALVPPHEWFALHGGEHAPSAAQLRRTVGICAEQPGTPFFEDDVEIGSRLGAVLDVSRSGVRAFKGRGLDARHFPLGWTPTWSHVSLDAPTAQGDEPEHEVDVLHLGNYSHRRGTILAQSARHLTRWRCRFYLSDDHGPNFRAQPNYTTGEAKWDLLRRSRVLLNIHVSERPYFEWLRVVQAVSNGCLVVSEHSTDYHPMEVGRHFLSGRPESLALLAQPYLEDESRRRARAREAWLMLKEELPFSRSVEQLVEAAEQVDRHPVESGPSASLTLSCPPADPDPHEGDEFERIEQYPYLESDIESSLVRQAMKSTQLEVISLRRELAAARLEALEGQAARVGVELESPAYSAARPHVSVLVSLYNLGGHVGDALDSCAASRFREIEIVVVDDGSTDGSLQAAREWSAANPGVPLRLIRHPHNRGLAAARNCALDFARADLAFILDADNELYRDGLGRLVAALEANREAAFAYGMIEVVESGRPVGLRSYYPWRPARLRTGNYIDAMALWRTGQLRDLGGYTSDMRMYGWEDYDLWCRAAERGLDGVLVPEIVARYRQTNHSMITLTNVSTTAAVSLLADRYPRVMGGLRPPP